jgi:hypothetical protein
MGLDPHRSNAPQFGVGAHPELFQQVGGGKRRRSRSHTPHETSARLRTHLSPSKRDTGLIAGRAKARRQAAADPIPMDMPSSDFPEIIATPGTPAMSTISHSNSRYQTPTPTLPLSLDNADNTSWMVPPQNPNEFFAPHHLFSQPLVQPQMPFAGGSSSGQHYQGFDLPRINYPTTCEPSLPSTVEISAPGPPQGATTVPTSSEKHVSSFSQGVVTVLTPPRPSHQESTDTVPTDLDNDEPCLDQELEGDDASVPGRIGDRCQAILEECWREMNVLLGVASRRTKIPPHQIKSLWQKKEAGVIANNIWNTYANYFRGHREEEIHRAYGDNPPAAGVLPSQINR